MLLVLDKSGDYVLRFFLDAIDGSLTNLAPASVSNISLLQNQQRVAADVTTSLDIGCELSVDMNLCTSSDSDYLCLFIGPEPATASFSDTVTTNNVKCLNMAAGKQCYPGACWKTLYMYIMWAYDKREMSTVHVLSVG